MGQLREPSLAVREGHQPDTMRHISSYPDIISRLGGSATDREDQVLELRLSAETASEPPGWASDDAVVDALASIAHNENEDPWVTADVAEAFAFLWLVGREPDLERFKRFSPMARAEVLDCLKANKAEFLDKFDGE